MRGLLNVLAAASLLLLAAVVTLWVRSYFATDTLRNERGGVATRVVMSRGEAFVATRKVEKQKNTAYGTLTFGTGDVPIGPDYHWLGSTRWDPPGPPAIGPPDEDRWMTARYESFRTMPLWWVAAGAAAPLVALLVLRRRTRRPVGRGGVAAALARAGVTGSAFALILALVGWADCEMWNTRSLAWQEKAVVMELFSHAGTGRLSANVSWEPLEYSRNWTNAVDLFTGLPAVEWSSYRVAPEKRGGYFPQGRRWLAWLEGRLYFEEGSVAGGGAKILARRPRVTGLHVVIPYWFVVVMSAIPPCASIARNRRRRRRALAGLCHACGYDLRASPGRCPECGARAPATA